MRAAPTQPHCRAQSPQNICTGGNLGKGECPQATRLEGCRGGGRAAPGSLLEDTPPAHMGLWRPCTGNLPHCSGETEAQRGCPRPHQESCHSRDRVLGPGSPHCAPAFLTRAAGEEGLPAGGVEGSLIGGVESTWQGDGNGGGPWRGTWGPPGSRERLGAS